MAVSSHRAMTDEYLSVLSHIHIHRVSVSRQKDIINVKNIVTSVIGSYIENSNADVLHT